MKLILVRHAETEASYKGRYVGSTDILVSDEGAFQVTSLAERLREFSPDRCLCSPMLRTKQTAEIICGSLGLDYHEDAALKEIDFGNWEGLTFKEISKEYPAEAKKWADDVANFQFPGGEKNADFWARIKMCASHLDNGSNESLLVVTHGGVIRAMICYFLGLTVDSYLLFDVQPSRFTTLDIYDNLGVLTGFNL